MWQIQSDHTSLQENILLKNMQNEVSKIAKQYKISKKVGRAYVTALANKAAKYYGYTVTKTTTKSGDKVYTLKSADKTYKLTKGKTAYTVTEKGVKKTAELSKAPYVYGGYIYVPMDFLQGL